MIPVVFVHGFMGGSAQWADQEGAFGDGHIIAVDLPGYGANAHLDALQTIEGYAYWVLENLTARGVDRFHLIGHSMGGMIAQVMAAKSPDRVARLVLYGTGAIGVLPGRFETIDTSKKRAVADGPSVTARRISATWFLALEKAEGFESCAQIAERSSMQAILAGLEAMSLWTGSAYLPKLLSPTLVLWGDNDRTYSWDQTEQLWRSIRQSNLAVIPNCAHALHLEKPDMFNRVVRDFLLA
ncbi:MAG: alpha/beta hydrolase [Aliishimia sp.]